jgi:signal transduction histidine kinase
LISIYSCDLFVSSLTLVVVVIDLQQELGRRESEEKFLRYISHEIRTPLNTLFMGLKLMEEGIGEGTMGPAEAMNTVQEIKAAAEVALSVLNDMLMLDKVKQGALALELTEEEPYTTVKATVEGFNVQVSREAVLLTHKVLRTCTM